MSWRCVCVFREPIVDRDAAHHDPHDPSTWRQGWEECLDTLQEATEYLQEKADAALVGIEIGDDGLATGVSIRYDPA